MLPTRDPVENSFDGGKLRFSVKTDSIEDEDICSS
jgi:hypothetical protein